ncbi:tape measure domain-containing protein [Acinetobacter calcoaceticus]|uniref:Tape measure domain-containing protein n=1 Tax=Acinetobacter calcoaceticus TaxID=471 RepID=A0A4R1XHC1_ACICA|nr:tape measure domain-containing protein [Acinetobacter calcoaceticus]
MAQESSLRITIDTRQAAIDAREFAKELQRLTGGGDKAGESVNRLGRIIHINTNITQNFNTTVNNSTRSLERNTQQIDRSSRSTQDLSRNQSAATSTTNAMATSTQRLAGYLTGVITVGTAVSKMDIYTGLQNKLKLVTENQAQLNKAMVDTFAIAQNTAQAWDSVAQIYQRFSDNAKRLNITMMQTATLTDTVAKAISISGGSASSAEAALVQFSQALAANVLRGEELNSVLEQAPGLAKAIAQGMGVTVGQLRSVAAEGKITGDVLVEALTNAKGSVDALFAKTDFTIAQSFTQLSNEVTKFVGEAGKGSGAAKLLSSSIGALAENLGIVANVGIAVAAGMLAKAMIGGAAATTRATYSIIAKADASIAERSANIAATQAEVASATAEARSTQITLTNIKATHAQIMAEIELEKVRLKAQFTDQGRIATTTRMAQLGVLQAQVALEIAAAETAQTASSARLSAALTAQSTATSRLALAKAALMGIFSPMGIAIAATAATFYLLSDSSDEVKESLATQADSVESLTEKYIALNSVQALVEGVRLRKEIEQQNDVIDDASSATQRYAYIQKELFKLSGSDYADYQKAITSIATGAKDAGELLNKMIASGRFSQEQIDKLIEFSGAVAESKSKIEQNNTALKLLTATTGDHVEVTDESIKKLTIQTNLTKAATQGFDDMKTQMLDSLQAQVEFIRLNGGSEGQIKSLNEVIKSYSLNQITATDAVSKFNSAAKIPSENIKGVQDLAARTDQSKVAMNQANAELKRQNDLQSDFLRQHQGVLNAKQAQTDEVNKQVEAQKKLNDLMKQKTSATMLDDKYWLGTYKASTEAYGGDKKKGAAYTDFALKFRQDYNLARDVALTKEQKDTLEELWALDQKRKNAQEDANKSAKDQTTELKKQQQIMQVNAKVQANAAKYGFSGLESKYGLPSGMLSAIHMIESKGDASATGPTTKYGTAKGGFQFLDGTAKANGVKDPYDLAQSAEGAAKYLQRLLKMFNGNVEKAVRAYHAGEGNVQRGTGMGRVNNKYIKDYYAYSAGINGFKGESKEYETIVSDEYKLRERSEQEKAQLLDKYSSEDLIRNKQRISEIAQAEKLGLNDLIPVITDRYSQEKKLSDMQFAYSLLEFKMTEEEKLKYSFNVREQMIIADKAMSKERKLDAKASLDAQFAYELEQFKKTRLQKQMQYDLMFNSRNMATHDKINQFTMSPIDYQKQQLIDSQRGAYESNDQQYIDDLERIERDKKELEIKEYYRRLEDAKKLHKDNEYAISLDYKKREEDLLREQQQNQLQLWGSLLGHGQNTWAQLTQSVKDANGEQSSSYKAMFLMQQSIAFASAIVSAHLAAIQTTADITLPFVGKVPAASAILAFGYANAGMIAAQTIQGMAHNGIDSIPKEGTWLLDGGERVLNPQQNRDLTSYLNNQPTQQMEQKQLLAVNNQQKGRVNFEPKIIINTLAGTAAETSTSPDGTITIDIVRREAGKAANDAVRQSWGRMDKQNSFEAEQIKRNFDTRPKRP